MNGTFFLVSNLWGLGEGPKGQILNFNYKFNFKYFESNFVCLLTNERYKTYQMGLLFCHLGHAPGEGLGGYKGVWASNFFLLN